MSGTVNYPKVIDHLADVIKELNCAPSAEPAEQSVEARRADTADLVKALLSTLEQAGDASAAAAAEHGAAALGVAPFTLKPPVPPAYPTLMGKPDRWADPYEWFKMKDSNDAAIAKYNREKEQYEKDKTVYDQAWAAHQAAAHAEWVQFILKNNAVKAGSAGLSIPV
jgi:hypothetical protein